MVENNQALSKYSGFVGDLNKGTEDAIARRSVELFFSFDIVNSSAYKTVNYTGWYKVIISLFRKIQSNVTKMMPSAEMWRVLGDEIIFIIPIKENKDFFVYTDKIFEKRGFSGGDESAHAVHDKAIWLSYSGKRVPGLRLSI